MAEPIITITRDQANDKIYATASSQGGWPTFEDVLNAAKTGEAAFRVDEAAIAKALEKQIFDKPFEIGRVMDGRVVVSVEPGEKEAYMLVEPAYGGREVEFEDVQRALRERSVFFGIDKERIRQVLSDRDFGNRLLIASAKDEINGSDARIEYLFSTEWVLKPKADNDDTRVDYRDVESVASVLKDAVLARKIAATPGENGITVTGKTIRAIPGKDLRLSPGKNTRLSEDGLELISEIAGQPIRRDRVSVEPIISIDGDVDYSTGNVDFVGTVRISGSVISGFSVKASANIQIDGVVEDSQVEAGGDVLVRGGIRGRERRSIKAGGSVSALFIEQAFVEAGHSIVAQEVLHSELIAGEEVVVTSGKGLISGGRITAMNLIHAGSVGSNSDTRTELAVGFNPKQKAQLEALRVQKARHEATLAEIETGISTLERYRAEASSSWQKHEQTYQKLVDTRQRLTDSLERATYEIGLLEERLIRADNAQIRIARSIYPNVMLRIGHLQFQNETELLAAVFHEDGGEIKATGYA